MLFKKILKIILINFFLLFTFIIIITYLFEIYLQFNSELITSSGTANRDYKSIIYKKKTGKNYDKRTKYEFYEDSKNKIENLVISSHPKIFMKNENIFGVSGISNKKTVLCNESGEYVIFESDKYGFNNLNKKWSSTEFENVLVGDSFVQGSCINRPHDLASQFDLLNKKVNLNLGYNGNGPLIELATLREYLPKNTKNILWFFFEGNDLNNLHHELNNSLLSKYLNNKSFSQDLKNNQNIINDYIEKNFINFFQYHSELEKKRDKNNKFSFKKLIFLKKCRKFYSLYIKKYLIKNNIDPIYFEYFEKILKEAKNIAKKNNSNFYFIYLPEYMRYGSFFYDNYQKNKILDIIRKLNINYIDIDEESFSNKNVKSFFPYELPGHFNEKGNKLIAKTIQNLLKQ